jgi:hypothetical protein
MALSSSLLSTAALGAGSWTRPSSTYGAGASSSSGFLLARAGSGIAIITVTPYVPGLGGETAAAEGDDIGGVGGGGNDDGGAEEVEELLSVRGRGGGGKKYRAKRPRGRAVPGGTEGVVVAVVVIVAVSEIEAAFVGLAAERG